MILTLLDKTITLIKLLPNTTNIGKNDSLLEESPQHEIKIKDGLYLSQSAITHKNFQTFIKETHYKTQAELDGGSKSIVNDQFVFQENLSWENSFPEPENPVTCIAYNDAKSFCDWLTQKEIDQKNIQSSDFIRLPTEQEWEYATACNSNEDNSTLDQLAWFIKNSNGKPHPVQTKQKNKWGFYDLLGNVSEWTQSDFTSYSKENSSNNIFNNNQNLKVIRGGSWASPIDKVSVTMRGRANIKSHCNYSGFRVLLETSK